MVTLLLFNDRNNITKVTVINKISHNLDIYDADGHHLEYDGE